MKTLFIVLMVLCFMASTVYAIEMDNHERVFQQTQTFQKPVKEGTSKAGVWKDAPNVGLVDPAKAYYFFDDFTADSVTETANDEVWLSLYGATIQDDQPSGEVWLGVLGIAKVNNMQVNGESFQLTGGETLWYETRFAVDQASTSDWFAGLAITDQSILAGVTDRIGFEDNGNDGNIDFVVERNNYEYILDTGFDMAASTMTRLGFVVDSGGTNTGNITAYVDDSLIAISSTVIPYDEALTPSYEVKIPTAGTYGSRYLELDYVKILQER